MLRRTFDSRLFFGAGQGFYSPLCLRTAASLRPQTLSTPPKHSVIHLADTFTVSSKASTTEAHRAQGHDIGMANLITRRGPHEDPTRTCRQAPPALQFTLPCLRTRMLLHDGRLSFFGPTNSFILLRECLLNTRWRRLARRVEAWMSALGIGGETQACQLPLSTANITTLCARMRGHNLLGSTWNGHFNLAS
jgi:hypothetical protein